MFSRFLIILAIIRSKAGLFIEMILLRWYVMVMIPAVIVTYYVFKGFQSSGLFDILMTFISSKLSMLVFYAKICPPKVLDLYQFLDCFNTPVPESTPQINYSPSGNQLNYSPSENPVQQ